MRKEREFQIYCSGTGGGPSLPALEHFDPDVYSQQEFEALARILTPFNSMTVQRRDHPSTITSGSVQHSEYTLPSASATATAITSASSSLSATVVGLSTGDGPINTVTNTVVDHTVTEFADTDGTTENVQDLQRRMAIDDY